MAIQLEKPKKTNTGLMQRLLVYEHGGGALLGSGWVIHHDGRTFKPTLIAFDGSELPVGWYNIKVTGEQFLIVVNDTVQ